MDATPKGLRVFGTAREIEKEHIAQKHIKYAALFANHSCIAFLRLSRRPSETGSDDVSVKTSIED